MSVSEQSDESDQVVTDGHKMFLWFDKVWGLMFWENTREFPSQIYFISKIGLFCDFRTKKHVCSVTNTIRLPALQSCRREVKLSFEPRVSSSA